MNLSHFSTSVYRHWVPRERNSSYNFIPIFLKLCTYFLHGLKICIWFGYNPCINFCYFFHFVNFAIFWPLILWKCIDSGYLVSTTPHTIFILIFLKLCTCFLHGLELCMWFGYNPWINFCLFFHFVNVVIFWPRSLWTCIDSGYLVSAIPYTTLHIFFPWFEVHVVGFNPAVNFCHFSTLLTFSVFNFSQVRRQLHQSLIYIYLSLPIKFLCVCSKDEANSFFKFSILVYHLTTPLYNI